MDPIVAVIFAISVFTAGIFVGWKWREIRIKEEIRNNEFDPYEWGIEGKE
jgi:hypothetical protein